MENLIGTSETSQNQNDSDENQSKNNSPDTTKKSSTINNKRGVPSSTNLQQAQASAVTGSKIQRRS
jgi:hypothetical protein